MSESNLINLGGLEFIMTYRGATQERRDNLRGVLRHLQHTYTAYTLYLIEADRAPTFNWSEIGDEKIRHVFIADDGPFPKAKLCNLAVKMCTSATICFHDADMIANPYYFPLCVNAVRHGKSDAFCPFLQVLNVSGALRAQFIADGNYDTLKPYLGEALSGNVRLLYENTPGAIVLFKREEYMRVGGYDPRFVGWGGEDDDLLTRAQRLGVQWHSVADDGAVLFHLHHDAITRRDVIAASERNREAASQTHTISDEELAARATELAKYFD